MEIINSVVFVAFVQFLNAVSAVLAGLAANGITSRPFEKRSDKSAFLFSK